MSFYPVRSITDHQGNPAYCPQDLPAPGGAIYYYDQYGVRWKGVFHGLFGGPGNVPAESTFDYPRDEEGNFLYPVLPVYSFARMGVPTPDANGEMFITKTAYRFPGVEAMPGTPKNCWLPLTPEAPEGSSDGNLSAGQQVA